MQKDIRLTQYSRGAGCGCKIPPEELNVILADSDTPSSDPFLWVNGAFRDDAAVYEIDEERGLVSTTDFFTPIIDDPFDFGRISAANALSDIYAMGADPLMAVAILGWPVSLLPLEVAREVIRGGRTACESAGIPLAGGHSIDSLEPIFGLAVTGVVSKKGLKRNNTARVNDVIYLTKPLGVGILTTAEKISQLRVEDIGVARDLMCELNKGGSQFGKLDGVTAMTDVSGFGLLGHLIEMADGAGITARLNYDDVPRLQGVSHYLAEGCMPVGTLRNFASYKSKVNTIDDEQRDLLCDPQTSGGLLIAVSPEEEGVFVSLALGLGMKLLPIGKFVKRKDVSVEVV